MAILVAKIPAKPEPNQSNPAQVIFSFSKTSFVSSNQIAFISRNFDLNL